MNKVRKRFEEIKAAHRLQKLIEEPPKEPAPKYTEEDIKRWLKDPAFWDYEQRILIAKALLEFYESRRT